MGINKEQKITLIRFAGLMGAVILIRLLLFDLPEWAKILIAIVIFWAGVMIGQYTQKMKSEKQ